MSNLYLNKRIKLLKAKNLTTNQKAELEEIIETWNNTTYGEKFIDYLLTNLEDDFPEVE